MINKKLLNELKIIFKKDYGVDLDIKQTAEIGSALVNLFEILARNEDKSFIELPKHKAL